ncbi:hypothetical protein LWI28_028185 [Acer negundo]|uniref:Uncharacterized protein n=1 Tax=Acer negundo TaxID=4023 RepID=A0AAD5NKW7_ACENE|nr:hypothetical protein LWI28_028185 [Acer negundo]
MNKESCKNENALRIAKVKESDYLVEHEKDESTIKILTKEQGVKGETLGLYIIKGDSSHPIAKSKIVTDRCWYRCTCKCLGSGTTKVNTLMLIPVEDRCRGTYLDSGTTRVKALLLSVVEDRCRGSLPRRRYSNRTRSGLEH